MSIQAASERHVPGLNRDDRLTVDADDLPPGWTATRQTARTRSLALRGEVICELARSLVGEWRVCPAGEILPRPQTFPTPAAAIAALLGSSPRLDAHPRNHPAVESAPENLLRPVIGSYFRRTAPSPRHRGS